jgi:hypothetical protein
MVEELDGGEDVGLAGKELVEQAVMQFRVEVGAAILEDDDAVVGVGGFEESGENDAAGGDAEEGEGIYVVGAEDHLKVGACKGADAVLGDDDVVRLGSDGGMDRAGGALKQLLVPWRGLDRAEKEIARTDLREIWAEADLQVDDAHPGGARALEDTGGTGEEFCVLHVDGDYAGLHVHAEDGGAGGIEGECVRHGGSFFCNDDRGREDNAERRSSQRKNRQGTAQSVDPRVKPTRGHPNSSEEFPSGPPADTLNHPGITRWGSSSAMAPLGGPGYLTCFSGVFRCSCNLPEARVPPATSRPSHNRRFRHVPCKFPELAGEFRLKSVPSYLFAPRCSTSPTRFGGYFLHSQLDFSTS